MRNSRVLLFSGTIVLMLFCTVALSEAFSLPDTGQTKCYNTSGNQIPCAGTGQDGRYNINPMSFNDNDNGTVTDNNTGFMWQKTGSGHVTWQGALDYCEGLSLAGHSDWRLPSKIELMSIVDYSVPYPIAGSNAYYWTSDDTGGGGSSALFVSFPDGGVGTFIKTGDDGYHNYNFIAKCVRGEQLAFGNVQDNGNGTVTVNATGLMWQKESPGSMAWQAALDYCEGLNLADKTDWRLPNVKEAVTYVSDWSSTTYAYAPPNAWRVSPYVLNIGKAASLSFRCVRGGESVPVPGTVAVSNTQYGSFVDTPFDLQTAFDTVSDVTGCEYCLSTDGTCDTEWTAADITGTAPDWTCQKTGINRGNGDVLTLNMRVASSGGPGTAIAITRTVDAEAPATTDNSSSTWAVISPVTVMLTPTDGSGSGVKQTNYCVDTEGTCTPTETGTSVNVSCGAGSACSQYVRYYSVDNVGNQEDVKTSAQIRQDLAPPNPPAVSGTSPTYDSTPTWNWESGDISGNGTFRYKMDNSDLTTGAMETTDTSYTPMSPISLGSHTLYVQERDEAGNWSNSGSFSITVELLPRYTLSITKSGTGAGAVTSNPSGIDCGGTCSALYDQGTLVTLTPDPDANSVFSKWSGACTGAGICQVVMSAAKSVTATFMIKANTWVLINGTREICINSSDALATALSDAGADTYPNLIKVEQGTYVGNFAYSSDENFDLHLFGGYAPGCATRSYNPELTILNGDINADNIGDGVVLNLDPSAGTGNILVDRFTIINGLNSVNEGGGIRVLSGAGNIDLSNNLINSNKATAESSGGGGIAINALSGDVSLMNNIIQNNEGDYGSGVLVGSQTGNITLVNNIITDNLAEYDGGGIAVATTTGNILLLNNTIANNEALSDDGGGVALLLNSDTATANIINNIIWGNTTGTGICQDIYIDSDYDNNDIHAAVVLNNNDFNQTTGICTTNPVFTIPTSNLSVNPLFVNAAEGNYHLVYNSPVINKGNSTAVTPMPAVDIDGNSRILGISIDIGADEYVPIAVTVATSKTSPQPLSTVGTVKFTGTATGGNGNYLYQFRLKVPGGNWTVVQDYSSSNFYNVNMTQVGAYEVFVYVRNNGSTAAYEAIVYTSFGVSPAVQGVGVTLDKPTPQMLAAAGTIKFTAQGSGGCGNYVYQFRMRAPGGSYTVVQGYDSNNIYNWTPTKWGTYDFIIYAKNAGSLAGYEAYRSLSFTIKDPVTGLTVNTDKTSPQPLAGMGTVKFTGQASGGSGDYVYQFRMKAPGGSWTVVQDYGSSNFYNWTPTRIGTYDFFIYAKNAGSLAGYEAYQYRTFTVTNPGVLVTKDKTSPQSLATVGTVKFTALYAEGWSGNFVYQFRRKASGGSWTVVQDYSSNNIYNWTPSVAGAYEFFVYAKEAANPTAYEAYQYMTFTVSP